MSTIFTPNPTAVASPPIDAATTTSTAIAAAKTPHRAQISKALATTALAATLLTAAPLLPPPPPSIAAVAAAQQPYKLFYGTAASAANYGGFGGNSDPKASAEYTYDVPEGWKEKLVSKVQKGTNGTDSEFYNPKKKTEKEYVTFLEGIRQLAPKDAVLNNLALSDVNLQDLISGADDLTAEETKDENGQVYYVYEVDGIGMHSLIKVTCARNKLYAHFVNAPAVDWGRDKEILRHLHESFKTVAA